MMPEQYFSSLDLGFARFMEGLSGSASRELYAAAALVSRFTRHGHVCVDLEELAGQSAPEKGANYPHSEDWSRMLLECSVVGAPGDYKPLILDEARRLYLYRYWDYERKLAEELLARAAKSSQDPPSDLGRRLNEVFPRPDGGPTDLQKVAAYSALTRGLCVISGGPGTGKTYTVAGILALALELFQERALRIKLAAPTGKAAARLQESISKVLKGGTEYSGTGRFPDRVLSAVPTQASTIHRLLGTVEGSPYFIYNSENMLPVDLLVIDEASMVDIALMSKLLQALPRQAVLIILGDRNQLASVEAGAVLGDICYGIERLGLSANLIESYKMVTGERFEEPAIIKPCYRYSSGGEGDGASDRAASLRDSMLELRRNYRFGTQSAIGIVSSAVREGRADDVMGLLEDGGDGSAKWKPLPGKGDLEDALKAAVLGPWTGYLEGKDPAEMLSRFDELRILCAVRKGPYGVERINALVEEILRDQKRIDRRGIWYRGRPVIITENDYSLRLFNGDVGIASRYQKSAADLRVFFLSQGTGARSFVPHRLPRHETVFATTVHKSQGSEFENVLLILPERDAPILTRELLYTGITRARARVDLWGDESIIRTAVSRRIERNSGLRDALWKGVT